MGHWGWRELKNLFGSYYPPTEMHNSSSHTQVGCLFFWVVRPRSSSASMKSCLPAITHHSLCLRSTTRPSAPWSFFHHWTDNPLTDSPRWDCCVHVSYIKLHMLFHFYFLWVGHKLRRWVTTRSPLHPYPIAVFLCVSFSYKGVCAKTRP